MSEPRAQTKQVKAESVPAPSSRNMAPVIRSYSLLGSATAMQRDPLKFLMEAHQRGDVVRMRFVSTPAYIIYHPNDVKHVLQENHRNYDRDLPTYKLFRPFLGRGLIANDGQSWLQQRRLMQPAFHRQRIANYASAMTGAAIALRERWHSHAGGQQQLDIAEEMMRVTLDILGQTLFSLDLSHETSTVGAAVTEVLSLFGNYLYAPFPPVSIPTKRNRRMLSAIRALDKVVYSIIDEHRKHGTDKGDLLSMLLAARDAETGEGMNDQQIRDEVMTLLIAGHETTANALAWTWYLLSQHPEVERRLWAELDEVAGGNVPTLEHLPRLTYTSMVLEEALRLYPPGVIFSRRARADDELGGYYIPAKSMIIISPYVVQRNPDFWPQPEVFDPERFTPDRSAHRPRYAYFPFGGGPHLCIGNSFAMMEAQLLLATIAQQYQLRLAPDHLVVPQALVSLRPKYGLPMTIHKR